MFVWILFYFFKPSPTIKIIFITKEHKTWMFKYIPPWITRPLPWYWISVNTGLKWLKSCCIRGIVLLLLYELQQKTITDFNSLLTWSKNIFVFILLSWKFGFPVEIVLLLIFKSVMLVHLHDHPLKFTISNSILLRTVPVHEALKYVNVESS